MIVKDFTNTHYIKLTPEHTVQDILQAFMMQRQEIACVERDGRLVGVVTKSRLYRAILNDPSLQTTAAAIMKEQIIAVQMTLSMEQVKDTLFHHQVGHAVVLDNEQKVYGVLTTPNLINGFLTAYNKVTNHLRTVIENISDAIISVDLSLNVTGFNQAAMAIYPTLSNDLLHTSISSLDTTLTKSLQYVMNKAEKIDPFVLTIEERKYITTFIPLIEIGKLVGAMVLLRDITEIEVIAAELASTKKLERMIDIAVELSFDAVVIIDPDEHIIRANKGFLNLFHMKELPKKRQKLKPFSPKIARVVKKGTATELIEINDTMCLVTCTELRDGEHHFGTLITIMFEQLTVWKNVLEHLDKLEQSVPYIQATFEELEHTNNAFSPLISKSSQMGQLKKEALIASNSHLPIFITGENGTGKSVLAKCIHKASKRLGKFVTVNCAAIPQELIEAEFFGYVDGAFTGAKRGGKPGKFELADKGTLFLDEIGDMPLSLQAKLLRVLQEQEVERLGDTKVRKVDVRIITATNKNLEELVAHKLFREDLYYRIHVIHLHMPRLHGRKEDINLLSERFLQHITTRDQKPILGFSPQAMQALLDYRWPGNVRQLENMIERASHFCDGHFIQLHHFPKELHFHSFHQLAENKQHSNSERTLLIDMLQQCNGNKSQAAKRLGISRTALYNKLKQFEIDTHISFTP